MQYVFPILFAVAGSLAGAWLVYSGGKRFMLKRQHAGHLERIQGTIVDVEQRKASTSRSPGRSRTTYVTYPIIEFTAASGKVVTFRPESGRSVSTRWGGAPKSSYEKGDPITVLYDPDDALKPTVVSPMGIWLPEILKIVGGMVLVAFALSILVAVIGGPIVVRMS